VLRTYSYDIKRFIERMVASVLKISYAQICRRNRSRYVTVGLFKGMRKDLIGLFACDHKVIIGLQGLEISVTVFVLPELMAELRGC
jgi:hypothetical protein